MHHSASSCEREQCADLHIGRLIEVFIELPPGRKEPTTCMHSKSSAMLPSHPAVGRSNRHRYDDARWPTGAHASAATRIEAPVAMPSSTTITVRPLTQLSLFAVPALAMSLIFKDVDLK